MKRVNKNVKLIIVAIVYLTVCWTLGHYVFQKNEFGTNNVVFSDGKAQEVLSWDKYHIYVDGNTRTFDNPWGYTAGLIDVDTVEDQCVLLTPNTSLTFCRLDEISSITLSAEIHPWVSELSDGAELIIHFMNQDGVVIDEDKIDVIHDDGWINIQYSLNGYPDVSSINIACNNGINDDDSGDWIILKANDRYISTFGNGEYVRSATYFSDAWPINFWNSEMDNLEVELLQIRNDGFDSIIIVIPWKEFQTSTSPIGYSDYTFEKLNEVMTTANEVGLDVYTRIGYTWDFYNDTNESVSERYLNILRSRETHDAWIDYAERMYIFLSSYINFKGAFLTWEDFWICLAICDNEDESKRINYAIDIGYQAWIENNFTIDEYNDIYSTTYQSYSQIPVPRRSDYEMGAFYSFYDEYLNTLLRETQEVFPNISMEVRMDADLINGNDGYRTFYEHTATYKCQNSDYTATMYGIPMGFENKGERVSYDEALQHTEYILKNLLNENDGKPIYVEQFLFMDNTPQFSYNAQVKEEEIGLYLEEVAPILYENTRGYGIWTYRDYLSNMLYNSQFALTDAGWILEGEIEFINSQVTDSYVCHLTNGSSIEQAIPFVRNHFDAEQYNLLFDVVECEKSGKIIVEFGNESKTIDIDDKGEYSVIFNKNDSFDLKIYSLDGDYCIDNICLYSFVQNGHLYNEKNEEMEYITNIRVLNNKLMGNK